MNDLRKYEFGDPAVVAERHEALSVGCAGCALHRLNAARSAYECVMGNVNYPDESNKTCRWWVKRRGANLMSRR